MGRKKVPEGGTSENDITADTELNVIHISQSGVDVNTPATSTEAQSVNCVVPPGEALQANLDSFQFVPSEVCPVRSATAPVAPVKTILQACDPSTSQEVRMDRDVVRELLRKEQELLRREKDLLGRERELLSRQRQQEQYNVTKLTKQGMHIKQNQTQVQYNEIGSPSVSLPRSIPEDDVVKGVSSKQSLTTDDFVAFPSPVEDQLQSFPSPVMQEPFPADSAKIHVSHYSGQTTVKITPSERRSRPSVPAARDSEYTMINKLVDATNYFKALALLHSDAFNIAPIMERAAELIQATACSVDDIVNLSVAVAPLHGDKQYLFEVIAFWINAYSDTITAEQSSSMLWAFAKSGFDVSPYVDRILVLAQRCASKDLDVAGCCDAIWALAKLCESRPTLRIGASQFDELIDIVCKNICKFSLDGSSKKLTEALTTAYTNGIWGVQKLNLVDAPDVIQGALTFAFKHFNQFSAPCLNKIVWAACECQAQCMQDDDPSINKPLDSFICKIASELDRFPPREASNILWSQAKHGQSNTFLPGDVFLFRAAQDRVIKSVLQTIPNEETKVEQPWTPLDMGMYVGALAKVICDRSWPAVLVDVVMPDPKEWVRVVSAYIDENLWYFPIHIIASMSKSLGRIVGTVQSARVRDTLHQNDDVDKIFNNFVKYTMAILKGKTGVRLVHLCSILIGLNYVTWRLHIPLYSSIQAVVTNFLTTRADETVAEDFQHCIVQLLGVFSTRSEKLSGPEFTGFFTQAMGVLIPKFKSLGPHDRYILLNAVHLHKKTLSDAPEEYVACVRQLESLCDKSLDEAPEKDITELTESSLEMFEDDPCDEEQAHVTPDQEDIDDDRSPEHCHGTSKTGVSFIEAKLADGTPLFFDMQIIRFAKDAKPFAQWSQGSECHFKNECKPCAFLYTKGCENGIDCDYCHVCTEEEVRVKKRETVKLRRKQKKQVLRVKEKEEKRKRTDEETVKKVRQVRERDMRNLPRNSQNMPMFWFPQPADKCSNPLRTQSGGYQTPVMRPQGRPSNNPSLRRPVSGADYTSNVRDGFHRPFDRTQNFSEPDGWNLNRRNCNEGYHRPQFDRVSENISASFDNRDRLNEFSERYSMNISRNDHDLGSKGYNLARHSTGELFNRRLHEDKHMAYDNQHHDGSWWDQREQSGYPSHLQKTMQADNPGNCDQYPAPHPTEKANLSGSKMPIRVPNLNRLQRERPAKKDEDGFLMPRSSGDFNRMSMDFSRASMEDVMQIFSRQMPEAGMHASYAGMGLDSTWGVNSQPNSSPLIPEGDDPAYSQSARWEDNDAIKFVPTKEVLGDIIANRQTKSNFAIGGNIISTV